MATHVSSRPLVRHRPIRLASLLNSIEIDIHMPRTSSLVTAGLLIGGLSIPVLMFFEIIPVTLVLAFIGLVMTGAGGIMALVLYGEI